jgi:hypothetical protein
LNVLRHLRDVDFEKCAANGFADMHYDNASTDLALKIREFLMKHNVPLMLAHLIY